MFAICRSCGSELPHDRAPLELCPRCEGSPLCDRCGHPRADHGQVFVRGVSPGCNRIVGDFQSLTSWRCDCAGFVPLDGDLRDASFARPNADPAAIPRLRRA